MLHILSIHKTFKSNFHLVKDSYLKTYLYVPLFMNISHSDSEWAEISSIMMVQGHWSKRDMYWTFCGAQTFVWERRELCKCLPGSSSPLGLHTHPSLLNSLCGRASWSFQGWKDSGINRGKKREYKLFTLRPEWRQTSEVTESALAKLKSIILSAWLHLHSLGQDTKKCASK